MYAASMEPFRVRPEGMECALLTFVLLCADEGISRMSTSLRRRHRDRVVR